MSEKVQLKGGICELDFGYNAKMRGYTTLMSDIPKLGEIAPHLRRSYEIKKDLNRMGNRSSGHFK